MDLSAIANLKEQMAARSTQKQQSAEALALNGFADLQAAKAQNFQDRRLLARAGDSFLNALRRNYRSPMPYLGMGLFYFILSEPAKARQYILAGMKENPGHPEL